MQMRLRALTNDPAAAQPALPPGPVAPVPAAGGAPGIVPPAAPGTLPATAAAAPAAPPAAPAPEKEVAGYAINFPGVDVKQVLDVYAKLVNRTLLMGAPPSGTIILHTQSPLTKTEAIEALQAVLAMNGIALVNIGDKFVKVLPPDAGQLRRRGVQRCSGKPVARSRLLRDAHRPVEIRQAQRDGPAHPALWPDGKQRRRD